MSFGLGRLSTTKEGGGGISIYYGGEDFQSKVVASKSGSRYHYPWCSGAQNIAAANKIIFQDITESRDAGYTPAANCKGLE